MATFDNIHAGGGILTRFRHGRHSPCQASCQLHTTRVPRDCMKPSYASSVPRPCSVAIYSPWRRLKSVLEETNPRYHSGVGSWPRSQPQSRSPLDFEWAEVEPDGWPQSHCAVDPAAFSLPSPRRSHRRWSRHRFRLSHGVRLLPRIALRPDLLRRLSERTWAGMRSGESAGAPVAMIPILPLPHPDGERGLGSADSSSVGRATDLSQTPTVRTKDPRGFGGPRRTGEVRPHRMPLLRCSVSRLSTVSRDIFM